MEVRSAQELRGWKLVKRANSVICEHGSGWLVVTANLSRAVIWAASFGDIQEAN